MGRIKVNLMYLYGASGHGKVIKDIVEASGHNVVAFIDDDYDVNIIDGQEVLHDATGLEPIIVSVGKNDIRKKIVSRLNCRFGVAIHPNAIVSPSAKIGAGSVIMAGAVVNAGAVIGKHCIINTGASVDHECILEDFVHIAPHAALCGQIYVGEGVLIGVGSCVIPCIRIGAWSVIGAGSAVIKDIPPHSTAIGVPARIIYSRSLGDMEPKNR